MPSKTQLEQLLGSPDIAEQVSLIEQLNQGMFLPETLTEVAQYLREHCLKVPGIAPEAVDIVGTGGDGANTLNFSTLAAMVAAKAGANIVKNGNKSTTSLCGSFDLLQELGVLIPETPEQAQVIFQKEHCVFLFAPYFHPIMAKVAAARKVLKERGEKTIFNCIGPLVNPSFNRRIVAGVFTPKLIVPYAQTLLNLGFTHAYVFYGDGLDELSLTGITHFARLAEGKIEYGELRPADLNLPACQLEELVGGDAKQNAYEARLLLAGKLPGPKTNMVLANAAAALQVESGFKLNWSEAINKVKEVLDA